MTEMGAVTAARPGSQFRKAKYVHLDKPARPLSNPRGFHRRIS